MPKRFGFSKAERLKSRKQIDGLFANCKAISVFPLRVIYQFMPLNNEPGLKVGVSASKRNFKKAVDRNRIKRLLREAYRLQRNDLVLQAKASQKNGSVFFIYTDKTMADFNVIQQAMNKCLVRLIKIITSENPS